MLIYLQLATTFYAVAKGADSVDPIKPIAQSGPSALGPSCDSILPERRAAFSDATKAHPFVGLKAGIEWPDMSPKRALNGSLSMALQQAQHEVLHLRKSWSSARTSHPRLLRGRAPTAKLAASRGRAGALVQVPGDQQHHGSEAEAAYNPNELKSRLVEVCREVIRLQQALNRSKSEVDSLQRSHSTAHQVSDVQNYQAIRERSSSVPLPSSLPLVHENSFDIVVNAFKRDLELEFSLKRYMNCSNGISPVAKIHVVWNDIPRSIPPNLLQLAAQGNLDFFVPPTSNKLMPGRISSRFWPFNFSSAAVFHVDDDVVHTCETLNDMFQIWRSDVDGMVGTSPRWLDLSKNWNWDDNLEPLKKGEYNIVFVTKGAFVHKRFVDEYWQPLWDEAREFVDSNTCGEDILFSAIHMTLVGPNHVYAIAGSVNHGNQLLMEGVPLHNFLNILHESYPGLTSRTDNNRRHLGDMISEFLRSSFPDKVRAGIYSTPTKKFWRSSTHPELSCRQLPLPCFNRDWPECWQECGDDPVRGNSVCFRGDGACYAGSGINYGLDFDSNTMVVCVGGECTQ